MFLNKGTSLPTRERGLKWQIAVITQKGGLVAPYAGAWIEIAWVREQFKDSKVAPYAGAWIEIDADFDKLVKVLSSLPTRERGLKY